MSDAYQQRQAILDAAGPVWRFRIAVERFERAIRNMEAHVQQKGSAAPPEHLWAEERIARRELMALCPEDGGTKEGAA